MPFSISSHLWIPVAGWNPIFPIPSLIFTFQDRLLTISVIMVLCNNFVFSLHVWCQTILPVKWRAHEKAYYVGLRMYFITFFLNGVVSNNSCYFYSIYFWIWRRISTSRKMSRWKSFLSVGKNMSIQRWNDVTTDDTRRLLDVEKWFKIQSGSTFKVIQNDAD